MLRAVITITYLLLLSSCAGMMRSGQYVRIGGADTLESLAKHYGVDVATLRGANRGLSPVAGDYYFIPQARGILGRQMASSSSTSDDNITEAYLNSGEFVWPVPSSKRISSGFGKRWGRHHEGIDIPGRVGLSVVAAADGKIIYSGSGLGGYGNITVILHDNGYHTVYAHAQRNLTVAGQRVYKGQVIAKLGKSGRSTGPHLHFEIRRNSRALNPTSVLAMDDIKR